MQITKGKIQLHPIGKDGHAVAIGDRDFDYPKDYDMVTSLTFDELLELCFPDGIYDHCRDLIERVDIGIHVEFERIKTVNKGGKSWQ